MDTIRFKRRAWEIVEHDDLEGLLALENEVEGFSTLLQGELLQLIESAASNGRLRCLRELLSRCEDMTAPRLSSALVEAIWENHGEAVLLLLDAGVDATGPEYDRDLDEVAPINAAFEHCNPDVVRALCESGAIDRTDPGWLDEAIRAALASRRKRRDACLMTLLGYLAKRSREGLALELYSVTIKKLSRHLTKLGKREAVDPSIVEYVQVLESTVDEEKALAEEIIDIIMEGGENHEPRVRAIIDPQPLDRRARLASAALPYLSMVADGIEGGWELLTDFLDWGADVHSRDDRNGTALIWCADLENLDVVKRLLELGADINAYDERERTALDWIEARRRTGSEIYQFLRAAGAKTFQELKDEGLV